MTRAELEQALVEEPTNPDIPARLAGEYLKLRNYPKVRELALKATQLQKHHPLGSFMLARVHMLVGDTDRAREILEPAVNRENPEPRVLEMLANLLTQAKQYDAAKELYELGRKNFPTDSKWVAGVARIALITDNQETLREALEQLCLIEPDDPSPRKKLARMAVEAKDWPRAARFARMILHINVSDLDAHMLLAEAMEGERNWSQAAGEYRSILELRPDDVAATIKLAKALKEAGDRDRALDLINKLLDRDPNNTDARELREELQR
jgi:tetratricopeptide (TPR) repeat protein